MFYIHNNHYIYNNITLNYYVLCFNCLLILFIRLSQAHAKLMFRNHVLVQDAIVAISLMECSNDDGSPDSINTLYTKFPLCPKETYILESKKKPC